MTLFVPNVSVLLELQVRPFFKPVPPKEVALFRTLSFFLQCKNFVNKKDFFVSNALYQHMVTCSHKNCGVCYMRVDKELQYMSLSQATEITLYG